MQPRLGVDVEVVGGLVEQQHVAAGEQDAGELDAAALAAGEHGERQVEAVGGEAEAGGEAAHLGLGRVAAVGAELLLGVGEAGDVARRWGPPRSRGAASRCAPSASSSPRPDSTWDSAVTPSSRPAMPRVLREVAERALAVDDTGRGGRGAAEHLEQARLAGAVAADEADLVAGAHRERRAFDDEASTDLHRDLTGL